MPPQRLLLFDIDGTLLTTVRKAFDFPFSEAIREVLGVEADAANYKAGGKTDPQILHELLASSGLGEAAVEAAIPAIRVRYLEKLRARLRAPDDAPLKPGVVPLLEALSRRDDARLALLTGNFEAGARVKLGVHDLNRYFPFGAFGDGARDRSPLPARARDEAFRLTGTLFSGKEIVIIGDTPNDIHCGRPLGVRTVAVATGLYGRDQLAAESPDFLFDDFTETSRVVDALLQPMEGEER